MTSIQSSNIQFGNIEATNLSEEQKLKNKERHEAQCEFNEQNPGAAIDLFQKLGQNVNPDQEKLANDFRTKYPNLAQYK